jgi:hypothetical protein
MRQIKNAGAFRRVVLSPPSRLGNRRGDLFHHVDNRQTRGPVRDGREGVGKPERAAIVDEREQRIRRIRPLRIFE